jgi:hypothetical protein
MIIASEILKLAKALIATDEARSLVARSTKVDDFVEQNSAEIENLVDAELEKWKELAEQDAYVEIDEVSTYTESDDYGPYTVGYFQVVDGIDSWRLEDTPGNISVLEFYEGVGERLDAAFRRGEFDFDDIINGIERPSRHEIQKFWDEIREEIDSRAFRKVVGDYLRQWGAIEGVEVRVMFRGDEVGTTTIDGVFKNNRFVWKADIKYNEDEMLRDLTDALGDTYKSTGVNTGDRRRD